VTTHFDSVILRTCTRLLLPMLAVVSIYMFFRGHNHPGGGFIAGLVLCAGLLIHSLAFGIDDTRRVARLSLPYIYGLGWALAVASGIVPMFFGGNFLASGIYHIPVSRLGEIHFVGSTCFDAGVYLIVIGVVTEMIFRLAEEPYVLRRFGRGGR